MYAVYKPTGLRGINQKLIVREREREREEKKKEKKQSTGEKIMMDHQSSNTITKRLFTPIHIICLQQNNNNILVKLKKKKYNMRKNNNEKY